MKLREELKWVLPLVAACLLVFANTLGGDFVYDDTRQIVRNVLIQDNGLIWKALASDVWAFKGDGSVAASNYWRPTFTLWNIICFRLFGMNPVGWHVANVLLHTGVCLLAYSLLRRWAFTAAIAFTIALIFAVHPVHVESVAWIAGSPDLLFALFFLGSLWFATSYKGSRSGKHLALMLIFYAAALGAKEIGIICLPIYYFVLTDDEDGATSKAGAIKTPLLMLGAIAVIYFLIRWAILGAISRPPDDPTGLANALLSVPSMFVFYLRQVFGPFWLGANYPLEPVTQIGLLNFIIPLAISAAALAGIWYLAKTSKHGWLATSLFLLPFIPAMNASMFPVEQLVHDRYLYLPLLGILILLVPFAARWLSERNVVIAGVTCAALLGIQTVRYNSAWANELTLWSWTRTVDDSSFTSMQLGAALADAGRNEESIRAYSAAIAKRPNFRRLLGRARGYLALKQYANAEKDLAAAFALPGDREAYALYQAYEALGIAYSEQRKYDAAITRLRDARVELPIYSAALTEKLAVVLYQAGQKDEALRELEGAKARARSELLPESKSVLFRLGMLYAELGRKDDARASLREFIDLTAPVKDDYTIETRNQAARVLRDLK